MECRNFLEVRICKSNDRTRVTRFIKKSGKLSRAVYAGLIVCFVPSVLSGWPRSKQQLTFDEIYNGTNYAQLQQRPRPYDITELSYDIEHSHTPNLRGEHRIVSHNYNLEDSRQPDTRIYRLPDHTYPVTPAYHIEEHTLPNKIYKLEDKRVNHPIRKLKDSIQLSKPKGLYIDEIRHIPESYSYLESDSDNELENVPATELAKVPLLVGVSHDPFRYSIPNEDYLRGVRDISQMPLGKGERGKRGVFHLYNMMYCATGCEPLSYKGYGCYCGFLGSGRPVDGIDNCCKMHDECYENIYCPFFTVYFQPYYWKCFRGQPLCALENYETQHQFINGCAARLCECDRKFAMCVRRYRCPTRRALCRSSPLRLLQNLIMF